MDQHQLVKELCDFSYDKFKIRKYLHNFRQGTSHNSLRARELLALESKWRDNPTLYRSLKGYFKELREKLELPIMNETTRSLGLTMIHGDKKAAMAKVVSPINVTSLPFQRIELIENQSDYLNPEPQNRTARFPPSPQLIHDFYEAQGIVGEEKNRELLLYGALAKANLGIESLAGSGKSALLYALLQAFPKESYKIIHQATGKSLFNNPERNNVKFWVIPELQKIFTQDIEDLLKNLTEGVSATYTRTNARRDGVDSFEIEKKAVLYSFAITNKHLKERDDEFYRRFIILHTDISRQQNQEVARKFAERDFTEKKGEKTDNSLPQRIAVALDFKGEVKNPFLRYIVESLPTEISGQMRFRSSVKYLHSLVAGCTLFYSPQLGAEEKVLFSTLQDNQRVMELYGDVLVDNLYGLSVVERAILDLTSAEPRLHFDLMQEFLDTYSGVKSLYTSGLERLTSAGLLKSELEYVSRTHFPEIKVDAEKALASADELMKKHYQKKRDEWYALNNQPIQQSSIQQYSLGEQARETEQNKQPFREVDKNGI